MKENKYYIVKLQHGDDYFPAICKRKYLLEDLLEDFLHTDFGWYLFRENYYVGETYQDLLTGKLIYNAANGEGLSGKKRVGCLTYRDVYGYGKTAVRGVQEISNVQVFEMLKALSDEQIDDYRMILNEIENDAIKSRKEMLERQKQERKVDEEINRLVNRGR